MATDRRENILFYSDIGTLEIRSYDTETFPAGKGDRILYGFGSVEGSYKINNYSKGNRKIMSEFWRCLLPLHPSLPLPHHHALAKSLPSPPPMSFLSFTPLPLYPLHFNHSLSTPSRISPLPVLSCPRFIPSSNRLSFFTSIPFPLSLHPIPFTSLSFLSCISPLYLFILPHLPPIPPFHPSQLSLPSIPLLPFALPNFHFSSTSLHSPHSLPLPHSLSLSPH